MASTQPIVRQIKYISLLPQLLVYAFLIFIYYLLGVEDPLFFGIITYLVISFSIRNIIPIHHRRGVRFYKNKEYEKAIVEFQKSYIFFENHRWIDTYRFIVLLSSSRVSYIEMSLINMAFCYGQTGNGLKSKELYERTLSDYPDSQMAKTALKMYEAAKDIDKEV